VPGSKHPITAYYSIYRPRKDERLGWPSWLTCSGHPSAAGRAQDSQSLPAKDGLSTTVPRHQLSFWTPMSTGRVHGRRFTLAVNMGRLDGPCRRAVDTVCIPTQNVEYFSYAFASVLQRLQRHRAPGSLFIWAANSRKGTKKCADFETKVFGCAISRTAPLLGPPPSVTLVFCFWP